MNWAKKHFLTRQECFFFVIIAGRLQIRSIAFACGRIWGGEHGRRFDHIV